MFESELRTRYNEQTGKRVLLEPLRYKTKTGRVVVARKGFETDLDSIGRIPIVYSIFKSRTVYGAVIHDWLYSVSFDRKTADRIFLEAMKDEGVKLFYRAVIYSAVRMFGFIRYNKVQKQNYRGLYD